MDSLFHIILGNLPYLLVCLTAITGVIMLVDRLFFKRSRPVPADGEKIKEPWLLRQAKEFFPIFLIVLIIRSFFFQFYNVPTSSLAPTVIPGETLFVDQFSYGLRFPVWSEKFLHTGRPKRGDIAVFRWPVNPKVNFVKRVIGVPGDIISLHNGVLTINGKVMKQKFVRTQQNNQLPVGPHWKVKVMQEDLDGVKHDIYLCASKQETCPGQDHQNFNHLIVPTKHYFMMGDNRINSDDSRDWGFVPFSDFVGKARMTVLSWNKYSPWSKKLRWSRMWTSLSAHSTKTK
jgi:signal peptidase I